MDINPILCDNQGNIIKKVTDELFIIDGSNLAFHLRNSSKKPQLKNLVMVIQKLKAFGIQNYYAICDSGLNYIIDNKDNYQRLINEGNIIETPAGTKADIFILQIAQENNGFIISNDKFKNYNKLYRKEWIKQRRISFKIINDNIFFDRLILKDL